MHIYVATYIYVYSNMCVPHTMYNINKNKHFVLHIYGAIEQELRLRKMKKITTSI